VQPPASLKALADPIYEAFYGLREQPFAISTDPKFLFFSASHRRAYEELLNGILRDESLLLLTGETGSGKTTLCRAVIGGLERNVSCILHQPYMTGPEMLRLIVRDFGLVTREELRRGVLAGADVAQLLDVIETFLRTLVPIQARAIVVLDEAQSLSPTLLDEIRMLTAFEEEGRRLVQIVLCGQPMLLNTLKTEPMYALNERITRRVVLQPLSKDEIEDYINHRLSIAGAEGTISFQPDAIRLIGDLSRGLPRRVNLLCDRVLQEGRVDGVMAINAALVKRAARSLAGAAPAPDTIAESAVAEPVAEDPAFLNQFRSRTWRLVLVVGLALLVVLGAGYGVYASSVVGSDLSVPDLPTPPPKRTGGVAPPVKPPTDAELLVYFEPLRITGDDRGDRSDQLPDNRHELD
jgi:type II secretory pathway predicted ATPase ExeA